LPERLWVHFGRKLLLKFATVVVGNAGLIHDKKQQALVQVGNCRTRIIEMN
jgi:hypothetical protein